MIDAKIIISDRNRKNHCLRRPMLERLKRDDRHVQALVLVPTRELTLQPIELMIEKAKEQELSLSDTRQRTFIL